MRPLVISADVRAKLQNKHNVTEREIEQCFENRCGNYLKDIREEHRTTPETYWFVARTNHDRELKVCFTYLNGNITIKTAYEPNLKEIEIYERKGK